jgi:hypothetical protein
MDNLVSRAHTPGGVSNLFSVDLNSSFGDGSTPLFWVLVRVRLVQKAEQRSPLKGASNAHGTPIQVGLQARKRIVGDGEVPLSKQEFIAGKSGHRIRKLRQSFDTGQGVRPDGT